MAQVCTRTQYRRFADLLKTYMWGIAWEFAGGDTVRASLAQAVPCRMYSAGVLPTVGIIHATHDLHIPDDIFYDDKVRAFTEAASFLIGLHNDLFSFPKEHLDAAADVNLLAAVLNEDRCPLAEAVTRLITFSNQIMSRLTELRDQLLPSADQDLAVYLHAAVDMVAGHIEFERNCVRYRRGDVALPVIAVSTTVPPAVLAGPPQVPTIAWWWSV